jgi:hypothetical protein
VSERPSTSTSTSTTGWLWFVVALACVSFFCSTVTLASGDYRGVLSIALAADLGVLTIVAIARRPGSWLARVPYYAVGLLCAVDLWSTAHRLVWTLTER